MRLLVMVVIIPLLITLLFLYIDIRKGAWSVVTLLAGIALAAGVAYNLWGIGGVAFIAVAIGFIFYAFHAGG